MQGWVPFLGLSRTQAANRHVCTRSEPRSTQVMTSPGSGQQPMAREEQGTQASILQPCCCLTSQHQAICSQGASQRRSSVIAFRVQLKTCCCTVVRKRMQTQSFQSRQREGARWVFSDEYLGRKAWKESSSVWQQQLLHHHRKTSGKIATGELS